MTLSLRLLNSLCFALFLSLSGACAADGGEEEDPIDTEQPVDDPNDNNDPEEDPGEDPQASEPLSFMSACTLEEGVDDPCDTEAGEFCFGFNNNGPHCTRECTSPDQCEAPSRGCNNMGVCKSP